MLSNAGLLVLLLNLFNFQVANLIDVVSVSEFTEGLQPGKFFYIKGTVPSNGRWFSINVQAGLSPKDDVIGLHISVRIPQNLIALNTFENKKWQNEIRVGELPFTVGEEFKANITALEDRYEIVFDNKNYQFPHRIQLNRLTHLLIEGDVLLSMIGLNPVLDNNGQSVLFY